MKRSVSIHGMEKLRVKLNALPRHVDSAARFAVQTETTDLANDVREAAPVKTGALKEGIQGEYDDATVTGTVATTADHSKFVIHGTEDTPANDFMTPAAKRSQRRFRRRLIKQLKVELEEVSRL